VCEGKGAARVLTLLDMALARLGKAIKGSVAGATARQRARSID
jgi:hypothetical protein